MSVELKPCPFCGEMLEKKHVRKTKSRNGYDYYQHPDNECILADVNDGFPLTVFDNNDVQEKIVYGGFCGDYTEHFIKCPKCNTYLELYNDKGVWR